MPTSCATATCRGSGTRVSSTGGSVPSRRRRARWASSTARTSSRSGASKRPPPGPSSNRPPAWSRPAAAPGCARSRPTSPAGSPRCVGNVVLGGYGPKATTGSSTWTATFRVRWPTTGSGWSATTSCSSGPTCPAPGSGRSRPDRSPPGSGRSGAMPCCAATHRAPRGSGGSLPCRSGLGERTPPPTGATRYDKTPESYFAGLHLRASVIWIKDLTRTRAESRAGRRGT